MCPRIADCHECYQDSLLYFLDSFDLNQSRAFEGEELELFRTSWCAHDKCSQCRLTMRLKKPEPLKKYIVTFTQDNNKDENYRRLVKVFEHFQKKHTLLRWTFELTTKGNPHLHMQVASNSYLTKNITMYRKLNVCLQIDIQLQKGNDTQVSTYFKKDDSLKNKMLEYNIQHQKI